MARARAIRIISVGVNLSACPRRQLELDVHQLALLQGGAWGLTEKGHNLSDRVLELQLGTTSRFHPECWPLPAARAGSLRPAEEDARAQVGSLGGSTTVQHSICPGLRAGGRTSRRFAMVGPHYSPGLSPGESG